MTVLNQIDAVEYVDISRVNREQIDELFQPGGHASIEICELFQMLADHGFLFRGLFQDTLGYDICRGFFCNDDLCETVADLLQGLADEAESRIIEDLLLYAADHAEPGLGTHLGHGLKESQIQDDLPLVAGSQIGQELVNDDEIALLGVFLLELCHGLLDNPGVIADAVQVRNFIVDASGRKVVLNFAHDDFAQRHGQTVHFQTQHFKLAGNDLHIGGKLFILEIIKVLRIGADRSDHGHQVRFTGTEVADHHDGLVIDNIFHLQLVNHGRLHGFCHRVRHDICADRVTGSFLLGCLKKLNGRFNGFETDQF